MSEDAPNCGALFARMLKSDLRDSQRLSYSVFTDNNA
jgi:hypothetical protein